MSNAFYLYIYTFNFISCIRAFDSANGLTSRNISPNPFITSAIYPSFHLFSDRLSIASAEWKLSHILTCLPRLDRTMTTGVKLGVYPNWVWTICRREVYLLAHLCEIHCLTVLSYRLSVVTCSRNRAVIWRLQWCSREFIETGEERKHT
jgi:hypothetical protein